MMKLKKQQVMSAGREAKTQAKRPSYILATALLFLVLLHFPSCSSASGAAASSAPLTIYCAAGLHRPMTELGAAFEETHHIRLQFNFAGSNTLLAQMQLVNKGDVYIPASDYYRRIAAQKGLIHRHSPFSHHIPVLTVPPNNPKGIRSLSDLTAPGLRLALGDPQAAAIGKTTDELLTRHGLLEAVEKNVVTRTATVNQLVAFAALGQVDAAIMWEELARTASDRLMIVDIPESRNQTDTISACILTVSTEKERAAAFLLFLHSPEAAAILKRHHLRPLGEDR